MRDLESGDGDLRLDYRPVRTPPSTGSFAIGHVPHAGFAVRGAGALRNADRRVCPSAWPLAQPAPARVTAGADQRRAGGGGSSRLSAATCAELEKRTLSERTLPT